MLNKQQIESIKQQAEQIISTTHDSSVTKELQLRKNMVGQNEAENYLIKGITKGLEKRNINKVINKLVIKE